MQRCRARRIASAGASLVAVLAFASDALSERPAQSVAAQCAAAWKGAQTREDNGRLREAREMLLTCAKAACGPIYLQKCTSRLTRLENDIPTVVPVVADESGTAVEDVEVDVDGELLASRIDGRGHAVDPGLHEFSFSTKGAAAFAALKVLIVEGQRNRELSVVRRRSVAVVAEAARPTAAKLEVAASEPPKNQFDPLPDVSVLAEQPAARRWALPRSPLPYALGAFGVVSIGTGVLLTVWGNRDNDALGQCAPNCSASSVSHIRTLYVASDVAFVAGVASLGVAGWLFATSRSSEGHSPKTGYSFGVQPSPSGALGTVVGTF